MFIPIASPVDVANRTNNVRPANTVFNLCNLANLDVDSNAIFTSPYPSCESIHSFAFAATTTLGKSIAGPRVMQSCVSTVVTPPPALRALQPREVDATSVPSAVAIGIGYSSPSILSGPATPSGIGMYPITFSQQAPITR